MITISWNFAITFLILAMISNMCVAVKLIFLNKENYNRKNIDKIGLIAILGSSLIFSTIISLCFVKMNINGEIKDMKNKVNTMIESGKQDTVKIGDKTIIFKLYDNNEEQL